MANIRGKVEEWQVLFSWAKKSLWTVTAGMKLKRRFLLGRKAMTNLDSILRKRHYFASKGLYSQSYVSSSSHVRLWVLDHKNAECQNTDAFKLWCWIRLLRVPWTTRRSNQSFLMKINPEYSLEGLKLWYLTIWCQEPTLWKRPWHWKGLKVEEEGGDRGWDGWMASPTQWTDFEQTLGDSERQRSLACYSPQGHKELEVT